MSLEEDSEFVNLRIRYIGTPNYFGIANCITKRLERIGYHVEKEDYRELKKNIPLALGLSCGIIVLSSCFSLLDVSNLIYWLFFPSLLIPIILYFLWITVIRRCKFLSSRLTPNARTVIAKKKKPKIALITQYDSPRTFIGLGNAIFLVAEIFLCSFVILHVGRYYSVGESFSFAFLYFFGFLSLFCIGIAISSKHIVGTSQGASIIALLKIAEWLKRDDICYIFAGGDDGLYDAEDKLIKQGIPFFFIEELGNGTLFFINDHEIAEDIDKILENIGIKESGLKGHYSSLSSSRHFIHKGFTLAIRKKKGKINNFFTLGRIKDTPCDTGILYKSVISLMFLLESILNTNSKIDRIKSIFKIKADNLFLDSLNLIFIIFPIFLLSIVIFIFQVSTPSIFPLMFDLKWFEVPRPFESFYLTLFRLAIYFEQLILVIICVLSILFFIFYKIRINWYAKKGKIIPIKSFCLLFIIIVSIPLTNFWIGNYLIDLQEYQDMQNRAHELNIPKNTFVTLLAEDTDRLTNDVFAMAGGYDWVNKTYFFSMYGVYYLNRDEAFTSMAEGFTTLGTFYYQMYPLIYSKSVKIEEIEVYLGGLQVVYVLNTSEYYLGMDYFIYEEYISTNNLKLACIALNGEKITKNSFAPYLDLLEQWHEYPYEKPNRFFYFSSCIIEVEPGFNKWVDWRFFDSSEKFLLGWDEEDVWYLQVFDNETQIDLSKQGIGPMGNQIVQERGIVYPYAFSNLQYQNISSNETRIELQLQNPITMEKDKKLDLVCIKFKKSGEEFLLITSASEKEANEFIKSLKIT